jgi:hypothetical protein
VFRRDAPKDAGEAARGLDETWWRERSAESLNRIADLERRIQACEGMDPPSAGRHIREHDHDRKIAALNDCAIAQDQLDVANRQRENLEEDARRQGVPPGWLR